MTKKTKQKEQFNNPRAKRREVSKLNQAGQVLLTINQKRDSRMGEKETLLKKEIKKMNTEKGQATYSPEDNKLRMYPYERLDKKDYQKIKDVGFRWAPKQELFVKPSWSPQAEDLMIEFCGSIEDEDKSPEDRAADRAERFAMYRDKRRGEAGGFADTFEAGPAIHGFQSEVKAERSASRHDRQRVKAFTQWDKAEYWQTRTKAVICHALYKADSAVRRSRVLRLEAEQRKHNKAIKEAEKVFNLYDCVRNESDTEKAFAMAYQIANYFCHGFNYKHPRQDMTSSMYSLLTHKSDPITGHEAAEIFFKGRTAPNQEGSICRRWQNHFCLRLSYEKQMLESEGGNAAEVKMIPGGFIGKHQIQKVTKSHLTKKVVSVVLMAPKPWYRGEGVAPLTPQLFNIQRLGVKAYRAPTDEEIQTFQKMQQVQKTLKQAANAIKPKLINPTMQSAQKLQDIWNAKCKVLHDKHCSYSEYKPTEVRQMTQIEYSQKSKGTYSNFSTSEIGVDGHLVSNHWNAPTIAAVCKVREGYNSTNFSHQARSVIVLTDKLQKELPAFLEVKQETEKVKT